jgi:hypothetical protein
MVSSSPSRRLLTDSRAFFSVADAADGCLSTWEDRFLEDFRGAHVSSLLMTIERMAFGVGQVPASIPSAMPIPTYRSIRRQSRQRH